MKIFTEFSCPGCGHIIKNENYSYCPICGKSVKIGVMVNNETFDYPETEHPPLEDIIP